MGSSFRSEEVVLCQLFLQSESAYACVSELGDLGIVQFIDLNPEVNAFQRKFVKEVCRCDEMEQKLQCLEKEITKENIPILDTKDNPEAPQPVQMNELEVTLEDYYNDLLEVNQNIKALKQSFWELTELKHVLCKVQVLFDEGDNSNRFCSKNFPFKPSFTEGTIALQNISAKLSFVTGVIVRERIPAFERMLWRACHGNVILRHAEIESPVEDYLTGDLVNKSAFTIFFQGEMLKMPVKRICEGFRATLYPCPETTNERREMQIGVMTKIEDLNIVLSQVESHRFKLLVSAAKLIQNWFVKVRKIKAIYHTLNLFNLDVTHKCLIAECWVPMLDMDNIQQALRRGAERSGGTVSPILNCIETFEEPPTYNRTNKFTHAFQGMIDAYGVASYREVNPAPYTIITFPFLFAIMFGDLGHGIILSLFAAWMIFKEKALAGKKSENEIWNILFCGRYVILLMGLFSMYTGVIYNDMFGKSFNVLGSHWKVGFTKEDMVTNKYLELDPKDVYLGTPYIIGLDPVWQIAENKIKFLNAYKMKISIIIGVLHMLFGVSLSVWNYVHFQRLRNLYTKFFPQIIFMLFLFFYMVVLIFVKWTIYGPTNSVETGPFCAPSILITFINMVLFKDSLVNEPCSPWMYTGQKYIQYLLVVIAMFCIPWMLLAKPYLTMKEKKSHHYRTVSENCDTVKISVSMQNHCTDMAEIWIHQAINTIEYVLGSVSHTASYLRLWALSLAHAQLSEVLWKMVMSKGLSSNGLMGGVILFTVFSFWAVLTVGILILMEGLSAFLHTLRLHWVEFQSKFYDGNGHSFQPFSFKVILN